MKTNFCFIDTLNGAICEFDETQFAWQLPSGVWGGWYETRDEAFTSAPAGACVVEKRISQRIIGGQRKPILHDCQPEQDPPT